jgi:WD40 repeat protein
MPIRFFERTSVTQTVAAFTHPNDQAGNGRQLSVIRLAAPDSAWASFPIGITSPIKALALDDGAAYALTSARLSRTNFASDGATRLFPIPPFHGNGFLTTVGGGVAAAFDDSGRILFLSPRETIETIDTAFNSFNCLGVLGDDLLCAVPNSTVIRMIPMVGRESHLFVGHCAPITTIAGLSDRTFASSGRDSTVRVWDIRFRFPVVSIAAKGVGVNSVSGNNELLVCGLANHTLAAFDLRKPNGKPILGIETQECEPINLAFNAVENLVAVFGVQRSETAMLFPGNAEAKGEGPGMFRVYANFI